MVPADGTRALRRDKIKQIRERGILGRLVLDYARTRPCILVWLLDGFELFFAGLRSRFIGIEGRLTVESTVHIE